MELTITVAKMMKKLNELPENKLVELKFVCR